MRAFLQKHMNARQRARAVELITNPPPGSKLAEAKEYGIDLTLLLENLALNVEERMQRGGEATSSFRELRGAALHGRAR
jgi:hypothetical protein